MWWGEKKQKSEYEGDTEGRTFWSWEGRKDAWLLCVFSLVINNLWKTVLPTRNAEGCFREVSGQKQKEVGRVGAVAEILLWTGMPLNIQQLLCQVHGLSIS